LLLLRFLDYLDAWIDFNINCSWADPGDHVLNTFPLNAGINDIEFTIPCDASNQAKPMPASGSEPTTCRSVTMVHWPNGEVEDYTVSLKTYHARHMTMAMRLNVRWHIWLLQSVGNFPTCTNNGPAGSLSVMQAIMKPILDKRLIMNLKAMPTGARYSVPIPTTWMNAGWMEMQV
jgi:hypothetical protein